MKTYIVGGAVRDGLLHLDVKDVDYVVVGSTPEEMLNAGFERVGADFPVFLHPTTKEEYALARTERKSGKGYLGFEVNSSSSITLEEDLMRRDLTINSMARDMKSGEIIDPFGGQSDLTNKILRHTSIAFKDDPLRVVRLGRFYARYTGFSIAQETAVLVKEMLDERTLDELHFNRFYAELVKVFKEQTQVDFFKFVFEYELDLKVSFFKNLFDTSRFSSRDSFVDFVTQVAKLSKYNEHSLLSFLGVIGNSNFLKTFDKEAYVLSNVVGKVRVHPNPNAETLYDILLSMKAWSQGELFEVSSKCVQWYSGLTENLLVQAKSAGDLITASLYPELAGKDLGLKIKAERINKIVPLLID